MHTLEWTNRTYNRKKVRGDRCTSHRVGLTMNNLIPGSSRGIDTGRKVPLGEGRSLMDWIRNAPKKTRSTKEISPEELSKHNTENDCWLCVRDIVYDVTEYISYHPGKNNCYFPPIFHMGKKIFNSNVFFYKICQAPNLYLTSRVLPIEFNSQKISFVRFVFVEFSGLF